MSLWMMRTQVGRTLDLNKREREGRESIHHCLCSVCFLLLHAREEGGGALYSKVVIQLGWRMY